MKKFLMTGMAAIALCAAFTSCSKDSAFEQMSPEDQTKAKYDRAFLEYIGGEIAPDQDWGFGESVTRTENANANEWADPNKSYGGLLVPPPLTAAQKSVVKKYFQTVPNIKYEDPHWTNYFMQQVYKGHTSVPVGCATPEAYMAADGHTYIIASDHMDHLAAIDGTFVDHINNFNHGDCSVNGTVCDNGGNANTGPFHSDQIMYMKESTTKSFGYYNSNGSVRHTEYTGLVSYQTIIDALGAEANCLNDGWNRSFMGFDFEQMVDDDVYAKNGNNFVYYTYNGKQYHYLISDMNRYCGDLREFNNVPSSSEIATLLADGYLPVDGSADKKWVKFEGCADSYYSDWIVCLTEANVPDTEQYSMKIIAEDLSAKESSDFDFNDIVLEVKFGSPAKVKLTHAGGTLPLRINGNDNFEVHKLFGVQVNEMVNTGMGPNKSPVLLHKKGLNVNIENAAQANTQLELSVYKNGSWQVLTAVKGEPACKLAVGMSYVVLGERVSIKDAYEDFVPWATRTGFRSNWWE